MYDGPDGGSREKVSPIVFPILSSVVPKAQRGSEGPAPYHVFNTRGYPDRLPLRHTQPKHGELALRPTAVFLLPMLRVQPDETTPD